MGAVNLLTGSPTAETDDRVMWITVKNATSSAIGKGKLVNFDVGQNTSRKVTNPVTANLNLPAGITLDTLAASGGALGRVQQYGYCAAASVSGATDVAPGDALIGANAVSNLVKTASATNALVAVALSTATAATAADMPVFIRGIL